MRVDMNPTETYGEFKIRPGLFLQHGASLVMGGINFSVYSSKAKSCELVLYKNYEREPFAVIPFPNSYRIGHVFAMIVFDLNYEEIEYGFRVDGKYDLAAGDIFDRTKTLLDPYAKLISGREIWGKTPDLSNQFQYRSKVVLDDFDWEGDTPLDSPHGDLIIYEMHVRGFTRHASSGVKYPGTYMGLQEKIPYLKDLGVNAVELLPIFEFDEFEDKRRDEEGRPLLNYWGYNTVGFFAPKAGYAAGGQYGLQVDELKSLIKELHHNGIKVILDVVFNHTAEGNEDGCYISFKGLDNKTYYILTPEGRYYNFSGCGNTLNCNHSTVRTMILNCLRYWVSEYHIDGFRFDLASILGRNQDGLPMNNPPLLESLAFDPLLGKCLLIAEAWDAGGLYQVGSFPSYGRWVEWNGKYRDDMRRFMKGDEGLVAVAAVRIAGSYDLYPPAYRGDNASINFFTCHDGFTLWDLYAYDEKHNLANGWNSNDGANDNFSWNCGWEGNTDNTAVLNLRRKMVKNAATVLLTSIGIPMFLAGDEFANTQYGNNNPYCQDNEISWLDWALLEKNKDIYTLFKAMIAFRKRHPMIRRAAGGVEGYPAISFHGVKPWMFDTSSISKVIGVLFSGKEDNGQVDRFIYLAINTYWETLSLDLPLLPHGCIWRIFVNTDIDGAVYPDEDGPCAESHILLGARSVMVLISSHQVDSVKEQE